MAAPIVVFSHLRWNFVFQRPQQLLSRLARSRRVIFIEEPITDRGGAPRWEFESPLSGVLVCTPRTPTETPGFCSAQLTHLRTLVADLRAEQNLHGAVAWFYTPMAVPLLEVLGPSAVIYDCMDELSAFLNAPRELLAMEELLLERADLVFTGGPSLYRAKKSRHPSVHLFPSSVDRDHFARAKSDAPEAEEQRDLARPRLGFFGVIDERFDREITAALAEEHPEWQIVLVGPVVKIDPASLPRLPNIAYFGQQEYAKLPSFLKGWDVCLLPFARNEATRFISPTKTLEYMAAERPIVSTPITDVAEPYGDIVYLGSTAGEIIAACEAALAEPHGERSRRVERMRQVLARTSWDATARRMEQLLEEHTRDRPTPPRAETSTSISLGSPTLLGAEGGSVTSSSSTPPSAASPAGALAPAQRRRARVRSEPPVVVIGAGPTGLSAGYHLGERAVIVEQKNEIGGWCRSIRKDGFTWDYAGHIMFSKDPYVHELYRLLLGDNVHWQDREAWIYSKGVYTRYPFQGALYGLPPEVIKECVIGAIEARYGSLEREPKRASASRNAACHETERREKSAGGARTEEDEISDCCGDGVLESTAALGHPRGSARENGAPRNFEEFIYKVWGAGIAKHFAIPYNRKLWAVPLDEMETSWLGGRVPLPNLEDMIEGALRPVPKPMGPNARFGYPLRGGFQALMEGFLPHLACELRLRSRVVGVSPSARTVRLADGTSLAYRSLVSTMPLPVLVRQIGDEAPAEVRKAAAGLRFVSVRCVHLGIGRENLTEKHWIYYPEDTVFHRIFVQGNASPHCNPPGGFGLTCEITYSEHKPLPCEGDALIERCIADCRRVGIFGESDPVWSSTQVDLPHAYVVYDHARPKNVATIRDWLDEHDILLAGRYSEWEYYNSDHAFIAGKKAAEAATERLRVRNVAAESLRA